MLFIINLSCAVNTTKYDGEEVKFLDVERAFTAKDSLQLFIHFYIRP